MEDEKKTKDAYILFFKWVIPVHFQRDVIEKKNWASEKNCYARKRNWTRVETFIPVSQKRIIEFLSEKEILSHRPPFEAIRQKAQTHFSPKSSIFREKQKFQPSFLAKRKRRVTCIFLGISSLSEENVLRDFDRAHNWQTPLKQRIGRDVAP